MNISDQKIMKAHTVTAGVGNWLRRRSVPVRTVDELEKSIDYFRRVIEEMKSRLRSNKANALKYNVPQAIREFEEGVRFVQGLLPFAEQYQKVKEQWQAANGIRDRAILRKKMKKIHNDYVRQYGFAPPSFNGNVGGAEKDAQGKIRIRR